MNRHMPAFAGTAAAGFLLMAAARRLPGFADWYTRTLYPVWVGTIGRLWGLFPFSVCELLLALIPAAILVNVIFLILHGLGRTAGKPGRRSPDSRGAGWRGLLWRILACASCFWLLYAANCGINYSRTSFAKCEGFTAIRTDSDTALLESFCAFVRDRLTESSEAMAASGFTSENMYPHGRVLERTARGALQALGESFPSLKGYFPLPKPILSARLFTQMGITGIYAPFTIEANYNREIPDYNLPVTVCHELSHLRGFMQEEEANFIGWLACVNSDDPAFNRSAWIMAWIWAGNDLYRADRDAFYDLYDTLPDDVREELIANNRFWDQYETKASEIQDKVNDTYLKANNQHAGKASYGMVTGLMLGWYADISASSENP